ncbi:MULTISPECIES: DUF4212 domain-containing protein [unclassified Duganella]|uniref:DUF4212 domain-containing protein n=1 Tax=unclassified Duganella TaxID=2636909 RepID=UPI0008826CDB|nr:putative solute:sodium symporter small subunit [Duganella sp. OV458]SDJ27018.1 putative solute:sodium symporter small subunit [Duganella sp. OV510]
MDKPVPPLTPLAEAGEAHAGQPIAAKPASPPAVTPPVAAGQTLLPRDAHWRRVHRMTILLLLLWLLTGFCAAFFARELAGLSVFGWPLSFYLAAQGASLVYLGIIVFYAWRMRKLDRAAAQATALEPHA